jgi:Tol biopolymer transport system component
MPVPLRPIARTLGSAAVLLTAGLAPVLVAPTAAAAAPVRTIRISVAIDGAQPDDNSLAAAISANGRYVAFESSATNLVPGDTNGSDDVFLRDRRAGTTTRISVSSTGAQADSISGTPAISADGRYVAFASAASTFVPGDIEYSWNIFVHDTRTGRTEQVDVSSAGAPADLDSYHPALSADGRYVAFTSYAGNLVPGAELGHVYRHDRATGETILVDENPAGQPADGFSHFPSISADGQHVAFTSWATDLAPGDTNGVRDVYVRDVAAARTARASISTDGRQPTRDSIGDAISGDGGVVLFTTEDSLAAGDSNGREDVYAHDVRTGVTSPVSRSVPGGHGNGFSGGADITPDGRYVVFHSDATNLAPGDDNEAADVFRRDLQTGEVILASRNAGDVPGNGESVNPRVTPDGRFVAYNSWATDLVRDDTNNRTDVLLADLAG